MTWRDVAGLDEVISELQDTVILPFQKRHLFYGSKLLQPPKGESWKKCMGPIHTVSYVRNVKLKIIHIFFYFSDSQVYCYMGHRDVERL